MKRTLTCKSLKTHLKRTLSVSIKVDVVYTGRKLSSKLNVKIKKHPLKNSMTFSTEVFRLQTTIQKSLLGGLLGI